jgi:glycosyltransferase involved in cell wall biosynthesis
MIMPTHPLLSIAVPTFNRSAKLERLLISILENMRCIPAGSIEVVISDNGSSDRTYFVGKTWEKKSGFFYHRHEINCGFEQNVESLLNRVSGEFVWLMGDDDIIEQRFLSSFIPLLERDVFDFVVVPDRREDWDPHDSIARRYGIIEPKRGRLIDFISEYGLFGILGGIGHCVFRRHKVIGFEELSGRKTLFPHVFIIARKFMQASSVMLSEPGFVVPVMSMNESQDYVDRWRTEGLWIDGWWNCMHEVVRLFEHGLVPSPVDKRFFRMMFDQNWPLHFHVYRAVAQKVFHRQEQLSIDEWDQLEVFDRLLDVPSYTEILRCLRAFSDLLGSIRENVESISSVPRPIF